MTDRAALLRTICEYPQDDTPRLIYADWLDENEQSERAELVRIQVELDRMENIQVSHKQQLQNREHELLHHTIQNDKRDNFYHWSPKCLWDEWRLYVRTQGPNKLGWSFTRGFIPSLICSWESWLKVEKAVYWHPSQNERPFPGETVQPIERVRFTDLPQMPGRWSRHMPHTQTLWFEGHETVTYVIEEREMVGDPEVLRTATEFLLRRNWPGVTFEFDTSRANAYGRALVPVMETLAGAVRTLGEAMESPVLAMAAAWPRDEHGELLEITEQDDA